MSKKFHNKHFVIILTICLLICSCSKSQKEVPSQQKTSLLIYMAADNDLDYYAIKNINKIEEAVNYDLLKNHNIYVFIDRAKNAIPSHPLLYKINSDKKDNINSEILKVYPEKNSCNSEVLEEVLYDIDNITKNNNEKLKGIILWSHGSAWLPKTNLLTSKRNRIDETKSFGIDETIDKDLQNNEMGIIDLSKAFSNKQYEFLIFDACYMASIEVIYELRKNFKYILASPTEILANGIPYENIIPDLLKYSIDYLTICDKFINYYNNLNGILKSASISVIKTSEMEKFSESFKKAIDKNILNNIYESAIQYDINKSYILFDIGIILEATKDTENKSKLEEMLNSILTNYKHTDQFWGKLNLKDTKGLSIFIPNNKTSLNKEAYEYYNQLQWYKDTNSNFN